MLTAAVPALPRCLSLGNATGLLSVCFPMNSTVPRLTGTFWALRLGLWVCLSFLTSGHSFVGLLGVGDSSFQVQYADRVRVMDRAVSVRRKAMIQSLCSRVELGKQLALSI